jgi:hypothetical protein
MIASEDVVGGALPSPSPPPARKVTPMTPLSQLIGDSVQIVSIREQIRRLVQRQAGARRSLPILILGETGTGKGLVARAIHTAGPRAGGPFIQVNCAAVPETLFEAELFGFEKGAFTGACYAKAGLFKAAARGTIFLDELSGLPLALQAKLLKVVAARTIRRVGSTRDEPMDAWIIAASNDDLLARTREGRFREDLYHRLAVVTLQLPPLWQRGRDVLLLAERFLAHTCAEYGVPVPSRAPKPDGRVGPKEFLVEWTRGRCAPTRGARFRAVSASPFRSWPARPGACYTPVTLAEIPPGVTPARGQAEAMRSASPALVRRRASSLARPADDLRGHTQPSRVVIGQEARRRNAEAGWCPVGCSR